MRIKKKKLRLLCLKWKPIFPFKFNKIIRNYIRRICRYSDVTYKKHLELAIAENVKDKEFYKDSHFIMIAMREELRVMHKDGVFYHHNVDFIKECAEIIGLDDCLGIEKTIAYAANIFTLKEIEKIETWEILEEMIAEKIEKGILKRVD